MIFLFWYLEIKSRNLAAKHTYSIYALLYRSNMDQPTGLELSTANVLVPDTTEHPQGSCRVYASAVDAVLAACGGPKA